jgi:hypothetical protein
MQRTLRGCLIAFAVLMIFLLLSCGVLVETSTPLSIWLYHHNYYFQDLVDAVHSPAK